MTWQTTTKPAVGHSSLSSWAASCSLSSSLPISCTGTRANPPKSNRRRLKRRHLRQRLRPHRRPHRRQSHGRSTGAGTHGARSWRLRRTRARTSARTGTGTTADAADQSLGKARLGGPFSSDRPDAASVTSPTSRRLSNDGAERVHLRPDWCSTCAWKHWLREQLRLSSGLPPGRPEGPSHRVQRLMATVIT